MRRLWKVLAVVSALSLAQVACSSGAQDDDVATLEGRDGSEADASASPSVDPEDALAEFAECMRDNGIEDFPDPQIDENGGITIGGPAGGDEGPPSDEDLEDLEAAMEACQELLPQGLGPGEFSEEDQAAFQDAMLEYAQCMRDQGIDFPDPDFSEGGGFIGGAEGFDPEDPDFLAADEVCRPILGDVFDGEGPGGGTVEQSN